MVIRALAPLATSPSGHTTAPLDSQQLKPDIGLFKADGSILRNLSNLTVRPNPFTPNGDGYNDQVFFDLGYAIRPGDDIKIEIFDERGRLVRTIRNKDYPLIWDGNDNHDQRLEGGLYFYQVTFGENIQAGSLVLVR